MKNQPLSERQQNTIIAIEQANDYKEMTTKSLMQTYKISPAKYAKNKMAVHCISDGSGYKTLAALIISAMPNVRYSGREHAYIVSPRTAAKFEAEMAKIQTEREATT